MLYIKTASIILALSMLMSLILTYASVLSIINSTKLNIERVLHSFVIENSTQIYDSIRDGTDYTETIDPGYFVYLFDTDHTLVFADGYLYNYNNGGYVYRLSFPETTFTVDNTLNLTCNANIHIPIHFAGKKVSELIIPLKVRTTYTLKE